MPLVRTEKTIVRLSPEEKDWLKTLAYAAGVPASTFLRQLLRERIRAETGQPIIPLSRPRPLRKTALQDAS